MCPAEGRERSRRSAGNTKKRKTCSQQKVTRIKRFWSKHFRSRNKTIFTEYEKSRLSSVNIISFLCLKAFTSQACYVNAFLLGTSLANLFAPCTRARSRPSAGHTTIYTLTWHNKQNILLKSNAYQLNNLLECFPHQLHFCSLYKCISCTTKQVKYESFDPRHLKQFYVLGPVLSS